MFTKLRNNELKVSLVQLHDRSTAARKDVSEHTQLLYDILDAEGKKWLAEELGKRPVDPPQLRVHAEAGLMALRSHVRDVPPAPKDLEVLSTVRASRALRYLTFTSICLDNSAGHRNEQEMLLYVPSTQNVTPAETCIRR